jgi:signal transduction histidine kinase
VDALKKPEDALSATRLGTVEAVAIADEVASTMRHDLRNKFASIRNAVFYIERSLGKAGYLDEDPRVSRFLTLICEQIEAADALLDQRSLHRSLVPTELEPVQLGECAQAAAAASSTRKDVRLEVSLADHSRFSGNPDELTVAIGCLLDNAIDAAGPSGVVTMSTDEDDEAVRLSIADDGPGMTAEQYSRALLPFSSEKPGHAGLGLNVASRVASRLGGTLQLANPGGRSGTKVELRIPKRIERELHSGLPEKIG